MPLFDHFDFLAPLYETFIPPKDPQDLWRRVGLPIAGRGCCMRGAVPAAWRSSWTDKPIPSWWPICPARCWPRSVARSACDLSARTPRACHFPTAPLRSSWWTPCTTYATSVPPPMNCGGLSSRAAASSSRNPTWRVFVVKLVAIAERLALMRSRFLSPPRIAPAPFRYANASVRVETERHNAWVIVEKEPGVGSAPRDRRKIGGRDF